MSTTPALPAVVTTIDDQGRQRISVFGAGSIPSASLRFTLDGFIDSPRRYQTNASLSQPPTMGADRPVREYVTNVTWRANLPHPAHVARH
jgi:hypothetical protein